MVRFAFLHQRLSTLSAQAACRRGVKEPLDFYRAEPIVWGKMNRRQSLIIFLVAVVGIGWLIGATSLPGEWYAGLAKPSFNPPNWVFAPVWTILYILIAVAGWRSYLQEQNGLALQLWLAQMLLNFLWSPVVFRLHQLALGLAVIVTMLFVTVTFIVLQWRENRLAAVLFFPYAAWVSFAALLNFSLYRLN